MLPLLLAALLPACPGGEPGEAEEVEPRATREAVIPPSFPEDPSAPKIELPEAPRSDADRIAFYIGLLAGGGQDEVAWATEMLGEAGEASARPLATRLTRALTRNAMLAENILRVFDGHVDPAPARPEILAAAKNPSDRVRMAAAVALGRIGGNDVVAVLLDLASEGAPLVSKAAVKAIDRVGSPEGARGLRGRFDTVLGPGNRPTTIRVIGRHLPKDEAVPFLRGLLEESDLTVVIPAALALAERGVDEGRDVLFRRYEEGDHPPTHMTALIETLAELEDTRALPILTARARKGPVAARRTAVALLSNYPQPAARSVLLEATADVEPLVRREAWNSLWLAKYPETLARLRLLLRSDDAEARRMAATLLGEFGAPESAPDLAGAIRHETERAVIMELGHALAKVNRPETAREVAAAMERETEAQPSLAILAHNLARALLLFTRIDDEAVAELARIASSPKPSLRMNALKVLERHARGEAARAVILAGLKDDHPGVREFAAHAWLRFPGADVAPLLEAISRETDEGRARTMASVAERLLFRWEE